MPDRLLDNYILSEQLFTDINNDRGKAICLNNMGNIRFEEKNFELAIEKFTEAYDCTKKLK
jgi:hypothetical protein